MSWLDSKPEDITEPVRLRLLTEQAMRIAEYVLQENDRLKAERERLLLEQCPSCGMFVHGPHDHNAQSKQRKRSA
jgi:uncharacterized OB-fold protein